jgi:quercetin dioxygenase-like cupin family protein
MTRRLWVPLFAFVAGAFVGYLAIPKFTQDSSVNAATRKPVSMTRLYTGADNQTHAEEVALDFTPGKPNDVSKLKQITMAELHRGASGSVDDWHVAPRRQYVITISGQGEIEVAGGKKISVGPGHIDLVEDTTGRGHVTRVLGAEDRVTLQLPLADQSGR